MRWGQYFFNFLTFFHFSGALGDPQVQEEGVCGVAVGQVSLKGRGRDRQGRAKNAGAVLPQVLEQVPPVSGAPQDVGQERLLKLRQTKRHQRGSMAVPTGRHRVRDLQTQGIGRYHRFFMDYNLYNHEK